jgi:hypothetical protein
MQNRKNLHDYGIVLILFGILNLFLFASSVVAGLVDGSIAKALATVPADILVAVKVVLGVIGGLTLLLVLADVFIGMKALKVSENPNADKGYITAAKVFFVLSVISAISAIVTLFGGNAPIVDAILNVVSSALSVVVYFLFVKHAQAVRRDVLNGVK